MSTNRPYLSHNRDAWDNQSQGDSEWCQPVDEATIAAAKDDKWSLILTPLKPVPRDWFGVIKNKKLLCLASGGGQQAPILAAAGADVTSFDLSDEQLEKDRLVARRDSLALSTTQGDMANLSPFEEGYFDLVFHPVSNVFSQDITTVWRECFRVLAPGGRLLSGFMNPDFYLFDHQALDKGGPLLVTYPLPFSDIDDLSASELKILADDKQAFEFSHSLDTQIGGQIAAGFHIAGFYEDRWSDEATRLNKYMPTSMATLAIKPTLAS